MGEGEEKVQYRGTKSCRGAQGQEWGKWGRKWLKFLCQLQSLGVHHPNRGAWVRSRTELGEAMVRSLDKPGEEQKTMRWHSLRRFRGAQFHRLGLPLSRAEQQKGGTHVRAGTSALEV